MNRRLAALVVIVLLASEVSAQERSPAERSVPGVSSRSFWSAGLGYPETVTGGVTVVLGKRRLGRIPGRGSTLRSLTAASEIGPGGASGRIGWTTLFEYDAGVDGW